METASGQTKIKHQCPSSLGILWIIIPQKCYIVEKNRSSTWKFTNMYYFYVRPCMAATLFQVCCDTVLWVATLRGFFFVFRGPYFQDWRLRYAKKSCFVWTRLLWLMGISSFVSNMNWRNSIFWTNSKFTKKLLWQWTKWEGSAGVNDASVA